MITASISGKKSGNAEELPGASVLVVRRNDLFLRVHHEGTAGYDRLAERLAREDDGAHAVSAARQRNDALLVGSRQPGDLARRSEEHTSELQSIMSTSYAVFC